VNEILWRPSDERKRNSRLWRYLQWLEANEGRTFENYEDLWLWSVTDLEGFWRSVWTFFGVSDDAPDVVLTHREMPGARWFPGTKLNYAEHATRVSSERGALDGEVALISVSQSRETTRLTWSELTTQVSAFRNALRALGVGRGDRVAAYLPNISETIVAFLATSSLGAVWSSCAPEFGAKSVIDRFAQIGPKVLLAVDGYRYGEKAVERSSQVEEIRSSLPTLEAVVTLPYLGDRTPRGTEEWGSLVGTNDSLMGGKDGGPKDLVFEPVSFDDPLYILYSSGTTGMPKPIVHGHGGILLEHLKALGLQSDLGARDRFLWFTTTGWMMWNFLVSGLLVGATVVCFDGDPSSPDLMGLWSLAEELEITYLGTSAPYLMSCRRAGLRPRDRFSFDKMRTIGSTGAPLPEEGFRWVYENAAPDVELASISGGTDVCTAFVGSSPLHAVRSGRISCRYLGAAVHAFSADGRSLIGTTGELVVTAPMPSMPVGFWGDVDGQRLNSAYFENFPGIWCHGDWITVFADGSCTITGRSDATLNRGGVRVGTAELYAVVESIPEVEDSLAIHLEDGTGSDIGELLLFVVLSPGARAGDELERRIRTSIKEQLSPRHVPDRIEVVPSVPRTLSGKKLEVPVKRILAGARPDDVASRDSLVDPGALDAYEELSRRGSPSAR